MEHAESSSDFCAVDSALIENSPNRLRPGPSPTSYGREIDFMTWYSMCNRVEQVHVHRLRALMAGLTRDVDKIKYLLSRGDEEVSHLCHNFQCSNLAHVLIERASVSKDRNSCRRACVKAKKHVRKDKDVIQRRACITQKVEEQHRACTHTPHCFPKGSIFQATELESATIRVGYTLLLA